ncbi:olfactory receptor 11A1-like [Rhineura floridana]|uniref:olfactory receptor 11A1-like n=1 Tax=Rhineura floridana TaxID=261503 RepID=UPI002AC85FC9|nr:olfactory receptor 11A1-like [Rhineura floridana]
MEPERNTSEFPARNITILEDDLSIHWQTAIWKNQSNPTTFILLGFGNLRELQILFFILFLVIYALSIFGNLLIVLLVVFNQHLHTPMYFFLLNLACLEICYTSTILPRMLGSFFTGDRSITIAGCFTQYYFFGFWASSECHLLAMMSFDRFLAICKPLHYTSIMNARLCIQLAATSWISGLLGNSIITSFLVQLTFCGSNEIDDFFCDVYPVANLSCSNTRQVKLATFIIGFMATGPPFLLTLTSYVCIFFTVVQIKSKAAQQKVFATCSSHLIVVTVFYGSLVFVYVIPETETLKELHKTFSFFYTILTPMFNPLIYSLRNREVKEAVFKSFKKLSNRVS